MKMKARNMKEGEIEGLNEKKSFNKRNKEEEEGKKDCANSTANCNNLHSSVTSCPLFHYITPRCLISYLC